MTRQIKDETKGVSHAAWMSDLKTLLGKTKIGFLATQGERTPETSMTPYAIHPSKGEVVLHLSSLAKHSKNVKKHAEVGLMICMPEHDVEMDKTASVLGLARLSLTGRLKLISAEQDLSQIDAGDEAYQAAYLQKIPEAEPLFSFADFRLYKLEVDSVFFVGGFGRARKVSLADWLKVTEVVAK